VLASPTSVGLTQRVVVGVELGAMVLLARTLTLDNRQPTYNRT